MSVSSTRSGRIVKVKHNPDAENVASNIDSGSHVKMTKSLSTSNTNKGRPPKKTSVAEKSKKNDAAHKIQRDVIRDASVKKTPLLSSPAKGGAIKTSIRLSSEEAAAKSKLASATVEIKIETERGPQMESIVQKENSREITSSSAVRRSSRAPVPSSRYKDMELDLSRGKKRSYTTTEEPDDEQVKKSRISSDKSAATDIENVNSISAHTTSAEEDSEIQSTAVVLDDGVVPLSIEDMIQSNLTEADLVKGKENVKNISSESVEIQVESVLDPIQTEELATENQEKKIPAFSGIRIGGHQLAFTEQDGKTVTVLTIPASSDDVPSSDDVIQEHSTLNSSIQEEGISFEIVDSDQKTFSDLVTVNPTVHNLRHVVKRDLSETPFATVVGQDGATYLNLSVEATKISSILKGKHLTTAKPANPLKGHGRVLRSPAGSMIMKTMLVPPRMPQQESSETKPSVTYSLLCPTKSQVDESTYSVSNSVSVPVSVMSSVLSQPPQRLVIRQHSQKTSSLASATQAAAAKPSETTVAVINFSQEMSNKNMTSTTHDSDKTTIVVPKTASEILLQRLKLQSKLATMKESSETTENAGTNYDTSRTVDEIQTASQQIISECVEHLDISHTDESSVGLSSKIKTTNEDSSRNFNLITVHIDTHSDTLSKNLNAQNALYESSHDTLEEDNAAPNLDHTQVQNQTENTDVSEDGIVVTTSDDSHEMPVSSSTLEVLKHVDSKESKTSNSAVNLPVSTQPDGAEQDGMTKIVHLSSNMGNLESTAAGKSKDHFIEKVRVVDNGVEYDVRIVSEEEVAEEVIDDQVLQNDIKQSDASTAEVEPEIVIKQEISVEAVDIKQEVEKQTSGTQTVYSPQVQSATSVAGTITTTTHTLATVVEEGSEKRQVYYVSVIPNKGIMAKTKTSMYSSAANWVIDDNGMYCCEKCDYQTDRKANFYKHRRSHTGAKPHVCPVCMYKAGTSSNLKRHMGIHKDIREHKCDICNLCFRQKIHLERHIKYKHEEKSIKCPMCDYICANEQPDLKMHIKRKHSTENSGEVVTCPECKIQVGNRKDLKQHMKFHKDGPELKLFCKECSFVTDCQSRLKRHIAIHSKMKPFQCGVCNYRAAQKEHVLRHLRTQHKIDIKRDGKRPWKRHKKTATEDGCKERADFTSGDKIFACNHCTMRFAKLINLYKHLHTQHGDIMPTETDGNFYCVVCEFSTTNKKNLLVHMRRHNMTDQTPPTHVYSCVLCRYVNPRRRNLFQHMRKKHNISISRQSENADGDEDGDSQEMEDNEIIGSVNRSMTPSNTVSVTSTQISESSPREMTGDLTSVASVIKIEDLTRMTASGENDDMQALVIDSRGADVTEIVHTTAHAAEALEGLQALAEQAGLIDNIIEEQVPALDEHQTVVLEQNDSTTEVVETIGGQLQHVIQSTEALASSNGETTEGLELSEDQLSSLRHGDMVEMEGHLYLVELMQDPNSPHKQMLSFLPVTTATLSQDSHD